jgi:hypothetical protein
LTRKVSSATAALADTGVDLAQGEKTRAWLVFQCDQGAALALLTIDGVRFRFQ